MHLDPSQTELLGRVTKARKRMERSEREARLIVLEAVAGNVPQSRIAESLGVSRMTLWRWMQSQQSSSRDADTSGSLATRGDDPHAASAV